MVYSMSMKQRIVEELKKAMKAKDEVRLRTLRGLIAEGKNREIKLRVAGDELREDEWAKIVNKEVKKRKEAIEMYEKAEREELAEQERLELKVLNEFAPKQMGESEVKKIVAGIEGSDFGLVMREAMKELKGKADGALVAKVVRQQLADI